MVSFGKRAILDANEQLGIVWRVISRSGFEFEVERIILSMSNQNWSVVS